MQNIMIQRINIIMEEIVSLAQTAYRYLAIPTNTWLTIW